MKKSILIVLGILTLSLTSCGSDSPDPIVVLPTCNDGIQNGDETGIDCGGSCGPCTGVENVSGLIT